MIHFINCVDIFVFPDFQRDIHQHVSVVRDTYLSATPESRLGKQVARTMIECLSMCNAHWTCQSVNFFEKERLCEIHNSTDGDRFSKIGSHLPSKHFLKICKPMFDKMSSVSS